MWLLLQVILTKVYICSIFERFTTWSVLCIKVIIARITVFYFNCTLIMSRQSRDFRELLKYKKESQSDGKNLEEFKQKVRQG